MKKVWRTMIILGALSQSAYADCWMQCIKSPFGGCMGKVKMCNITDTQRALDSLTKDLGAAYANLRDDWLSVYGRLPEELRLVSDRYPLTLAMLLLPDTQQYALFTVSLESYMYNVKMRARDIKEFVDNAPDWKHKLAVDGYTYLFVLEGMDVGNTDWNNPAAAPVPNLYDEVWAEFVTCLRGAQTLPEGNACLKTLRTSSVLLQH